MRYLLLLCILSSSFSAIFAQDYRIINPDRDYYYHDLNHVIHIDSAEVLGSGIRYYNYELIDFCDPVPPGFSKWLSHPITVDSSGVSIFQNDSSESITLRSNSQPTDTWPLYTYPNGDYLEAQHVATDWQSLFGNFDSVKTLSLSLRDTLGAPLPSDWNGKSFLLSKRHGLIQTYNLDQFPMDTTNYQLLGITNPKVGQVGISDREIFDFEVGDEMQYEWVFASTPYCDIKVTRWIILDKEVIPDSFRYWVEVAWVLRENCYGNETFTTGIDTTLYTYDVSKPILLPYQLNTSSGLTSGATSYLSVQRGLGGRIRQISSSLELFTPGDCWLEFLDSYPTFTVEGLGGPFYDQNGPWDPNVYHDLPIYYNKGGIVWGEAFDFDQYLKTAVAPDLSDDITLSPNPFSDNLHIAFPDNLAQSVNIELYDLNGKVQLNKKLFPGTASEINTTSLPAGLYLYRITADDGRFTTGKLVKR